MTIPAVCLVHNILGTTQCYVYLCDLKLTSPLASYFYFVGAAFRQLFCC